MVVLPIDLLLPPGGEGDTQQEYWHERTTCFQTMMNDINTSVGLDCKSTLRHHKETESGQQSFWTHPRGLHQFICFLRLELDCGGAESHI